MLSTGSSSAPRRHLRPMNHEVRRDSEAFLDPLAALLEKTDPLECVEYVPHPAHHEHVAVGCQSMTYGE